MAFYGSALAEPHPNFANAKLRKMPVQRPERSENAMWSRRAKPDEEVAGERPFKAGRRFLRVVNNRGLYKA